MWWAGTGSNRRPCGFQSLDSGCSRGQAWQRYWSAGMWLSKLRHRWAGFSLTATLTVDARWLVRTRCVRRTYRVAADVSYWASKVSVSVCLTTAVLMGSPQPGHGQGWRHVGCHGDLVTALSL